MDVEQVHDLLFPDKPELAKDPRVVLEEAFDEADTDSHQALLALYVYGLCLRKWETTESFEDIEVVLDALDEVADGQSELVRLIARQAQHVKHGNEVEQAMNCSCPVMMADRAAQIVATLSAALEAEKKLDAGAGLDGLRYVVRSDAKTGSEYFGAIRKIADTVRDFVLADRADFAGVLAELDKSERALDGDVYGSELRPHRASLAALERRSEEPRLLIRAAELAYVYPFTLDDFDEKTIMERLATAGITTLGTGELELNDIWVGTPAYSGAKIELPQIEVTTTARAVDEKYPRLESFRPEVRLSNLGNHHLVIRSRLEDAGIHELNQALRRGCDGMGAESLTWEGQNDLCEHFTDYAALVIKAVTNSQELSEPEFHVVLAARSIVQDPPDATPLTSEDLEKAARGDPARDGEFQPILGASLLFHPVRHLTTSLHEWVRYPPSDAANLLAGQAYAGDLVVRTDNTTVMFMPDSPEWLIDEYVEMIEFVASLPPLLALWQKQAEGENGELDRWLPDIEKRIERGEDPIDDLQEQETKIHGLESRIRRELAHLHSPSLVRTRAQRQFLNELWKAAGLPALESELERQLTLLAERQQRIATLVSSIDQRVRRKLERPLTIVIGLLAVASLAELLSWINQAFGLEGRRWVAVGEALTLATVAAFLLVLLVRVYYRRQLMRRMDRLLGPAFHELDRDLDDDLLDSFHRHVLAVSFSSDELEDADALARGLRGDGDTKVLASVAVGRDGTVLGGVVGEVYAQERVLLLAYLAVRPDLRGGGVGTRLMKHVAPRWYAHPDVRLAVAEVHDPRHWSDHEGDAAQRRLGLYERLGARVLEVPFVQPSLRRGRPRVPGFLLLAFHVDPSIEIEQNGGRAIPSDLVGGFVRRYFESAEEISAPYDAQLDALLARIEENPTIRLLPIDAYDQVPPLE